MGAFERKKGSSAEREASAWAEHASSALGSGWPAFIVVGTFLVLVATLVVSTMSSIEARILHRSGDQLTELVRGIRGAHRLWAEGRRGDVRALAASPTLADRLAHLEKAPDDVEAKQALRRRIEAHVDAFEFPSTAVILNALGAPITTAGPATDRARNFAEIFPDRFERVRRGNPDLFITRVKNPIRRGMTDIEALAAAPVTDDDGTTVGLVVWEFDPSSGFAEISSLGKLGRSSRAFVFDGEGRLVAGFGALSVGSHEELAEGRRRLIASTIEGQTGTFSDEYVDEDDIAVIGASIWDDELGLGFGAEFSRDDAFEIYFELRNVIVGSLVTMAALSLGLLAILGTARSRLIQGLETARARLEQLVDERTSALAELNRELRTEAEQRMRHAWELETAREALELANRKLEIIASRDALTGLANRRAFEIALEREWQRAMRTGTPLALLMVDVDDFKTLNDTQGHPAGDDALRRIGATLRAGGFARRPGDLISRFGGEEFALLLEDAPLDRAEVVAEEIRAAIVAERIEHPATCVDGLDVVSVSVGVSSIIPGSGEDPDLLVALADKALYRAKHDGRNRVTVSTFEETADHRRSDRPPPRGGHAPEA
jgi:diguanylate cyclase (GGDEF)-like protein